MTAATAGILLGALCFVPSANATPGGQRQETDRTRTQAPEQGGPPARAATETAGTRTASLAATGSVDTTPYLVGATTFMGFGTIMLVHGARRSRRAAPQHF